MFIRSLKINDLSQCEKYVREIGSICHIAEADELQFNSQVTFLVGENGSGKSTLLEAIAVKYGFNAEGGSMNFSFSTEKTHSSLYKAIKLIKGAERPKTGFFLRAESFYNAATYIDSLDSMVLEAYGGVSLHEQSHGESFFSLFMNRFIGNGLYILDEPEAALSPSRQMSFLIRLNELVKAGSQFIIATHSPILLAYPDSLIYEFTECGVSETTYKQTEIYQVMRSFMESPERMIKRLFEE